MRPLFVRVAAVMALMPALLSRPVVGAEAGEDAAALETKIRALRAESKYAAAASVARELLDRRRSDTTSKPYVVADATRLVATLDAVASLPDSARARMAEADRLNARLDSLYEAGEYARGFTEAERQVEIRRRLLGDRHEEVGSSLSFLAIFQARLGRHSEAERTQREALEVLRHSLGVGHPDVAATLNNLAQLHVTQGAYAAAESLFRESLRIKQELFGREHPDITSALNNYASLLRRQGNLAAAEPLYRQALSIRRAHLRPDHPAVATSLNNLALVLKNQGDRAGAEALYAEALGILSRAKGASHPDVATCLVNIASLRHSQGDLRSAEDLYRRAATIYREALGDRHPDLATALNNLALVLRDRGKYAQADSLLREALDIDRGAHGADHPDVAGSLFNLGTVLARTKHEAEAESLYRASLEIKREFYGAQHPTIAEVLVERAGLSVRRGDMAAAEKMLAEAAETYEAARLRAGWGMARAAFLESPYRLLAAARLVQGRNPEAWEAAERDLGRVLAELIISSQRRRLSPSQAARQDSLERRMSDLESQLRALRDSRRAEGTKGTGEPAERTLKLLLAVQAEWSGLQTEIAERNPVSEGRPLPLEAVQSALRPDQAIMGWLDVGDPAFVPQSWVYVIRHQGPVAWAPIRSSPAGERFDARSKAFHAALEAPSRFSRGPTTEARQLWEERIAPAAGLLSGVRHLIVIPSGAMYGVPVEALMNDRGKYVADQFAISYEPSSAIHTWLVNLESRNGTRARQRALLVGDPPFAGARSAIGRSGGAGDAKGSGAGAPASGESMAAPSSPQPMRPLPGTRTEVSRIASLTPDATVLLGGDASEQRLVELASSGRLADYGLLHLATHALIDHQQPERSALALSQTNLPDAYDAAAAGRRVFDGFVTAREIVTEWRLSADLVTLSACESGLGQAVGGEGYVGFCHAFFQAGARSLVVSLWKVDDRATSLLMRRFYQNYYGAKPRGSFSKVEALREAKQWLRSYAPSSGPPPFRHPYYWAGFILVGDPG